jgi:ABC-type dipeptide/oligopeptide/nickel transport system permease component
MPTNRIKRFSVIDRLFHLSLMLTFIIVVLNFFSDILLAYLDPRIKLEA